MDEVKDIVPQLLEAIQESYEDNVNKNILLQKMIRIIEDDKGDGETLLNASKEYGAALGKAFKEHVSEDILPDGKMYYNIAQRLLEPLMKVNYDNVAPLCVKVQTKLNKQNKMNLKAVKPSYKKEKTDGLVDYISSCEHYSDREESLIDAVETNSKSIVDDSVRENAEFQASCGMSPVIERYAVGKTCKWCASLAGTYQYPDQVPREVYKRHANCNCVVAYKPDKRAKDFQDVWSKQWNDEEKRNRIEKQETDNFDSLNPKKIVFFSGARILDPEGEYELRWAESYYEEIRHKSTDHKKIAERLKISEDEIYKIKRYIFFDGTWYNELTGRDERFVPDVAIAQSWQRLAKGKEIKPHDVTLIKHELYEMQIKKENPGISHDEAHIIATNKYDYNMEADNYYDNLNKRKKNR